MDKSQIEEQIEELKLHIKSEYEGKIKKLREEMEDVLSSLSRVEKTLGKELSTKDSTEETSSSRLKLIQRKKQTEIHTTRTVEARIMKALQEMNGESFARSELFDKVNNDGSGKEMKMGSFGPKFANLVKNGNIVVIREAKGNQGGTYKRAFQRGTQSEPSPVMR